MPSKTIKKVAGTALTIEKLPGYFLMVCLIVTGFLLFGVLRPFITTIFVAGVLTVAFYPIYAKIESKFGRYKRLSSLAACAVVLLIFVLPLTLVILLFIGEAIDTYSHVSDKINAGFFDKYLYWDTWENFGFLQKIEDLLKPIYDINNFSLAEFDLKTNIISWVQSLSSFLLGQTFSFVRGISDLMLAFLVMLFSMYYFFQDGKAIVKKIGLISPLPEAYETELFTKISSMVKAIVLGVFLTAIVQGLLGGIGFAIVGISNPIFWAVVMAFLSLVPLIGTAIVWGPAAIILIATGNYGSAIFLVIWGILLVGSVDNILRPYLIGGKAHTYPLLTFFVILGGILTLGFKGVVVGPLILMLFISFLHIYEVEYGKVLKK